MLSVGGEGGVRSPLTVEVMQSWIWNYGKCDRKRKMEAVRASFWEEQSHSQPEVWVCSVSVNLFITLAPLFASSGSFGASTNEELQKAASRGRHPLTHSMLPACGCKQPASHHCCDVSQRWLSCLLCVCLQAPPCSPASLSLCMLSRKCIEGFSCCLPRRKILLNKECRESETTL